MEEEEESYAPASNSASVCDASDCAVPPPLDYHPHFFHYIPDVQLCRECAISEAKFPSLSVLYEGRTHSRIHELFLDNDYLSLFLLLLLLLVGFSLSVGAVASSNFRLADIPPKLSALRSTSRDNFPKLRGGKPDGTDIEKREESLYNLYLDIINFTSLTDSLSVCLFG